MIYTQPAETLSQPPPVYVYKKSSSWTPVTISTSNQATGIDVTAIPLNPHYIHRPGVIAIRNQEKRSLVRASSAPRRQHRKRAEPLRAFAPVATKNRITLEIDGMKLTYDPKLTLEDRSSNLTKYFIDGRLYLIKNQRYNIVEHVDQASIDKYNRHLTWDSLPTVTDLWCSCTLLVGLLNAPSTLNWCIERTRSVTSSTTIWTLTKCLWGKGRRAATFLHRINNRTHNIVSLSARVCVCVFFKPDYLFPYKNVYVCFGDCSSSLFPRQRRTRSSITSVGSYWWLSYFYKNRNLILPKTAKDELEEN